MPFSQGLRKPARSQSPFFHNLGRSEKLEGTSMVRFPPSRARLFQTVCAMAVAVLMYGQAHAAEDVGYAIADSSQTSQVDKPGCECGNAVCSDLLTTMPAPARVWTIDYRFKSFCGSHTTYQIGTPELPPTGWAPLSLLRFPLDSSWNGVQVGVEKPNWGVHCEWLTPISQHIAGHLADYDWNPPNPDGSFTDLGLMREHWTDGQTINLDLECKLADHFFGLPIEVWPIAGFRWQRFSLTAYDLDQVKFDNQATRHPRRRRHHHVQPAILHLLRGRPASQDDRTSRTRRRFA